MKYIVDNVKNYKKSRGWICGQFFPEESILKNSELEVKYDVLKPGDIYAPHFHPEGTEIWIILKGKIKCQFDGKDFIMEDGDFIFMKKNVKESIIEVSKPTTTVTIRTPSIPNNKILVAET